MKIKKYVLVTVLLSAYALFMILYFGLDLLRSGQQSRFYITLIAEIIVITLAFFALRRRDRLRKNKDKTKG